MHGELCTACGAAAARRLDRVQVEAEAAADGTALYARQLIMAPFLGVNALEPLLGLPGLGGLTIDWGVGCDEERRLGRAGYCTMSVKNIRAARELGLTAHAMLEEQKGAAWYNSTLVQVLSVAFPSPLATFLSSLGLALPIIPCRCSRWPPTPSPLHLTCISLVSRLYLGRCAIPDEMYDELDLRPIDLVEDDASRDTAEMQGRCRGDV